MKNILIASTALVATAGVAAAEVTMDGYGRFGIFYQENDIDGLDETRIEQRFRLTITGVTESDSGVKFEGRIRFQTDENAAGDGGIANRSAAGFAASYGGLRLDVGNVSDVLDSGDVLNYYGSGVGLTSSIEMNSNFGLPASGFGTSSDDSTVSPTIKVRWQTGDLTVSASVTDDSSGTKAEEYMLGAGYVFGNWNAGVVFGRTDNNIDTKLDYWALGFGYDGGAFGVDVVIADIDDIGPIDNSTSWGISGTYDISAATQLVAVYSDTGIGDIDDTYGIGFKHDLGGGVSLRGGIGENAGRTTGDLGVVFNF